MKVYIASWFASKDAMKQHAQDLRALGIEITSRWLEEKVAGNIQIKDVADDYLRETAQIDIEDILSASIVVLNVPSVEDLKAADIPVSSWARGGRHFESGFQYALMMLSQYLPTRIQDRGHRRLMLVGHKENVFHYLDGIKDIQADGIDLPSILTFETWAEAKKCLTELTADERLAEAV
jgi:hypothetical protein